MLPSMVALILWQIICIALQVSYANASQGVKNSNTPVTVCCLAFDSTVFQRITVPLIYTLDNLSTSGLAPIYKQCSISYSFREPCFADLNAHQASYPACGDVTAASPDGNWTGTCTSADECASLLKECGREVTYHDDWEYPPGAGEWPPIN